MAATEGDLVVSSTAELDTGSGTLWIAGQIIPVDGTVLSAPGGSYRQFEFASVRVEAGATLRVVGPYPVAIHATGDINIAGTLDGDGRDSRPGAGGGAGGTTTPEGAGGGRGASGGGGGAVVGSVNGLPGESSGGWSGGLGGIGLSGQCGGGPGQTAGIPALAGRCLGPEGWERGSGGGGGGGYVDADGIVRGGSGGGSGTDSAGGAGGAAIALRSDTLVSVAGRVSAHGGSGAYIPELASGGGGGGGGGTIDISAPTVTVTGSVGANGGWSALLSGEDGGLYPSGGDGALGLTRVEAICLTGSDRFYPAVQFTRTGTAPLTDDSFATAEGQALTVPAPGVLANDCGANGAFLSAPAAHGTVTMGPDGGFTYQPSAGYAGTDSFQYTATPAGGTASQATVTITVRPVTPPAATLTAQVGQPIDADGSSTFSVKRGVVPVKFALRSDGTPTCDLPDATLQLTRLGATNSGVIDESTYLSPADTGSAFRVSECQYVYNLSVSALTPGAYRAEILIAGNSVDSATFELR